MIFHKNRLQLALDLIQLLPLYKIWQLKTYLKTKNSQFVFEKRQKLYIRARNTIDPDVKNHLNGLGHT